MAATRESWETKPLPETRKRIPYARTFGATERARLVEGLLPQEMEDKWFIFYEAGWLFLHRSWTGLCIYAVLLRDEAGGCIVDEAWVNRDPAQYRETDDAHDTAMLSYLVDTLLLGRDVPFPMRNQLPADKASLLKHHVVGHGRPPKS
jgi:hypothetical protein